MHTVPALFVLALIATPLASAAECLGRPPGPLFRS